MKFIDVKMEDKPLYETYLHADNLINRSYLASELNFQHLYTWSKSEKFQICFTDQVVYIRAHASLKNKTVFLPPVVKRAEDFFPALKNLDAYCKEQDVEFNVRALTKEMVDVINQEKHDYAIEFNRDYSEYLYLPEDLISLSGKKFNQKRNHLNYFKNNYLYTYRPYEKKDKQDIINLEFEWKLKSGSSGTSDQYAIDHALAFFDELNLKGMILEVDKTIAAFSIGMINHNNCGIVMFEKANTDIRGSFNAINWIFAKEVFPSASFINRQEDMGIEGLRKAKLSYNPVGLVEKFNLKRKKG